MLIWIVVLCGIALELYVIYSPYEIPVLSYFFPSLNKIPRPQAPDDYCGPYSKELNLFIRIERIDKSLWRTYINTTNPGSDSDYIEFKYHPLDGKGIPGIGLSFPDNKPDEIYVTDWDTRVRSVSSKHFQIHLLNNIDNYIGPNAQEDSLRFASECKTVMIGSYFPYVNINDDMPGLKEYLRRIEKKD